MPVSSITDVRIRDRELVQRARDGDRRAMRRLYEHGTSALMRDVARLLGSSVAAEEIAHEACVTAMLRLDRFDARASFGAWIRGIAMNLVRKHWRKQARRRRAYGGWEHVCSSVRPGLDRDPEVVLCSSLQALALADAVEGLSPPLREAFVLCVLDGLPGREAAALAGTSQTNIRVRATRARALLRGALTRGGWLGRQTEARSDARVPKEHGVALEPEGETKTDANL